MRVFCPEHNKGFFTPRQSPIRCESRGHVLGELDFQGDAKVPGEVHWQYCCNCEHFCPLNFGNDVLQRCPVCSRHTAMVYLCDRCFTFTFESNTPVQIKNFTLTGEGAPRPTCPACLQDASSDLREHDCEQLQARFITALTVCPICKERLDVGPVFPSSVAHYLRRTKASSKTSVTFDYDTELFVPVHDGEFVLISSTTEGTPPLILPRATRFRSRRDFYELYQDYYHCTNVNVGEIQVVEPAIVEARREGWRFVSTGILEVVSDLPKSKISSAPIPKTEIPVVQKPVANIEPPKEESPARACVNCGSIVETKYAFCWKCGNSMNSRAQAPMNTPIIEKVEDDEPTAQRNIGDIQQSILSSVPSWRRFAAEEEDESTVQHDEDRLKLSSSTWNVSKHRANPSSAYGSILKLVAVAGVGLLLVALAIFALTRSAPPLASTSSAQEAVPGASPNEVPSNNTMAATPQTLIQTDPREAELEKLREKRKAAGVSDKPTILRAFAKTEKRYPNDYRFPYERAKLVVKGRDKRAHEDAFDALSSAAEKAIKADKAQEMLEGLEVDKRGEFQKLAHGHREWTQVVHALKSKDPALLTTNTQ